MILTGEYFSKDVLKDMILKNGIHRAIENIREFSKLNKLFNSFNNYTEKDSNNIVFILCTRYYNNFDKITNMSQLRNIEKVLQSVNYEEWRLWKKNDFITKLLSDDLEISYSVFNELLFYSILLDQFNTHNLELYPEIGNNLSSDIKIKYQKTEIYIEIGCLGRSLPSTKIENILKECAVYFGKQYSNGNIKIEVNSSKFPLTKEGHINVKKTIEVICNELDRLNIYSLKPCNNYINIEHLVEYLLNEELYKPLIGELSFYPTLNELLTLETFNEWLNNNKRNIIKGFEIITTIYLNELDHIFIQLHTEYYTPSELSNIIHGAYINHIIRHIDGQLYQIVKNYPNIIAIHTDDLNMFIMGKKFIIDNSIILKLKNHMHNIKNDYLSGILLYEYSSAKSLFIKNPMYESNFIVVKEMLEKIGVNIIIA